MFVSQKIPCLIIGPQRKPDRERTFERILVATDFSPESEALFKGSLDLAKRWGARLTFIHFYKGKASESLAQKTLGEAWIRKAFQQGVKSKVELKPIQGSVAESIVDYAESEKMGLIVVMAQTGRLKSAWLGSVSREVVRTASCPVWVFLPRS